MREIQTLVGAENVTKLNMEAALRKRNLCKAIYMAMVPEIRTAL